MKKFTNLNVITNSLEICNALIKAAGIKIILAGGEVNKGNLSISGSTAVKTINKYNAKNTYKHYNILYFFINTRISQW